MYFNTWCNLGFVFGVFFPFITLSVLIALLARYVICTSFSCMFKGVDNKDGNNIMLIVQKYNLVATYE